MILEKQSRKSEAGNEAEKEPKGGHRNLALGACAAVAVLAVGITFFNSYQNMQGTVNALLPDGNTETREEVQSAASDEVQAVLPPLENIDEIQQKIPETTIIPEDAITENILPEEKIPENVTQEDADPERTVQDISETEKQETEPVQNLNSPVQEYVIQKGDTLSSICKKKYGTIARMDEICRLNRISPDDIIYAGEKIKLPD